MTVWNIERREENNGTTINPYLHSLVQQFEATGSSRDRPRNGVPRLSEVRNIAVAGQMHTLSKQFTTRVSNAREVQIITDIPNISVFPILQDVLNL